MVLRKGKNACPNEPRKESITTTYPVNLTRKHQTKESFNMFLQFWNQTEANPSIKMTQSLALKHWIESNAVVQNRATCKEKLFIRKTWQARATGKNSCFQHSAISKWIVGLMNTFVYQEKTTVFHQGNYKLPSIFNNEDRCML